MCIRVYHRYYFNVTIMLRNRKHYRHPKVDFFTWKGFSKDLSNEMQDGRISDAILNAR